MCTARETPSLPRPLVLQHKYPSQSCPLPRRGNTTKVQQTLRQKNWVSHPMDKPKPTSSSPAWWSRDFSRRRLLKRAPATHTFMIADCGAA